MSDKRRPEGRHSALAKLALGQHGVASAQQLRALGYSRDQISYAAREGRLLKLHRGVYAVGHRDLSWEGRCLATVLASAPALASHASAGRLWGLLRYEPTTFDVTASTRRRRKSRVRIHHAELSERDRAVCDGIPLTSVARTVLDLAAVLSSGRLSGALERADELGLFDLAAVDELLGRVTHHPGVAALRASIATYREVPAFTRSGLERRFLNLIENAGLAAPAMNYNVLGFELDAYWEQERLGVELDVYETHGSRAAFERDRLRDEELTLAGVEVVRITGTRLDREPEQVVERLGKLLGRRRGELRVREDGAAR